MKIHNNCPTRGGSGGLRVTCYGQDLGIKFFFIFVALMNLFFYLLLQNFSENRRVILAHELVCLADCASPP